MKSFRIQIIIYLSCWMFISSCGSLKPVEPREIHPLPSTFKGQEEATTHQVIQIDLASYFKDPQLLELFQKVVQANPDYQIAEQHLLISKALLKQSNASFFPSVDISTNAALTRYGEHTLDGLELTSPEIPGNPLPNYWLGTNVSWEVDVWGKLRNQKKAAKERFFASAEGMNVLRNRLFTETASLYYQLISLDKKLAVYQENYEIQQVAFEIISAQREAGKATELAVQQFSGQSQNILAEIEQIKIEKEAVTMAISSLIGEYGATIPRSDAFIVNTLDLSNTAISVDSTLHQRPDVAEKFHELVASKADAKAARAAFFPTLQISGFAGFNSFSISQFFDPTSLAFNILGGLTAPIFNQGKIRTAYYVANRQQEIAFFNYQNSLTTAYNEISVLLFQTEKYQHILQLKEKEIQHMEAAVSVSDDLYLTGYANYLEIINSQKQKLQTELDYIDYQLLNANTIVQLFKALGGETNK